MNRASVKTERIGKIAIAGLIAAVLLLAVPGSGLANTDQAEEWSPYLQNVTRDSIVVMWKTGTDMESLVRYRLSGESDWSYLSDSKEVTTHEVTIKGLSTESKYEYQVCEDGCGTWSPVETFRTAPCVNKPFRFVAYGDSRCPSSNRICDNQDHKAVIESIKNDSAPDFFVHVGDFVIHGSEVSQWKNQFFDPAAGLIKKTPFFTCLGNHEYMVKDDATNYKKFFSLPGNEEYYAFTYGCARFIVLNTNEGKGLVALDGSDYKDPSDQVKWLEKELQSEKYRESKWQFVIFHDPPYTCGKKHYNDPENSVLREKLAPLLEEHGVDMVFNGDSHNYERSYVDGVYYIVTGGGGAPLHDFITHNKCKVCDEYSEVQESCFHHCSLDVSPAKVELKALKTDGGDIDNLTLEQAVVNDLVLLSSLETSYDPAPAANAPAGIFTVKATFTSRDSSPEIENPFFYVAELTGDNLLLNADGCSGGKGAILTPDVDDDNPLSPGESFTVEFTIGLKEAKAFRFFVDLLEEK